jgi:hypothetical protein
MGKRGRRRRRELLASERPRTSALPPDIQPALVGTAGDSVTRQLSELVEEQRAIEAAVEVEIDRLVALGVGWPQISMAMGVSRHAARQWWMRRSGA